MVFADLIPIYMAILATVSAVAVTFRYIFTVKIKPIEDKMQEANKKEVDLQHEINSLKELFLKEVKKIAEDNFEFRLRHEQSISEIKILLAEKHIDKQAFYKELDKINQRIDNSKDIKTIAKAIQDLT